MLLTLHAQCLDLGICHTASRIQALVCKSPEPFALSTQPCKDGQQGSLEVGLPARLQGISPPFPSHTLVLGLRMSQTPLAHPPQGSPGPELNRQPDHPLWWLPGRESAPGRQPNSPSFCLHPLSARSSSLPTTPSTAPTLAGLVCRCPSIAVSALQPVFSEIGGSKCSSDFLALCKGSVLSSPRALISS